MACNPTRLVRKVLTELVDGEAAESLTGLLEILENKLDPEADELRIVTTLYAIQEKMKILESQLSKYLKDEYEQLPSNKLEELYNKAAKREKNIYE